MCSDADRYSYIFGKTANVCSGRTADDEVQMQYISVRIRSVQFTVYFKLRNIYRDRLSLYLFAFACKLVQLFPRDLLCRIHRRNLLYLTPKFSQNPCDHFRRNVSSSPCLLFPLSLSCTVAGIGRITESNGRYVLFFVFVDELRQPRSLSYEQDEYTRRKWIEGAGMAYLFRAQHTPNAVDHVVRCKSFGFVDDQNSVHVFILIAPAKHAKDTKAGSPAFSRDISLGLAKLRVLAALQ